MSRPSKLTPERKARLCDLLRVGHSVRVACIGAGLSESTYGEWRRRGHEATSGAFRQFLDDTDAAIADAERALFDAVVAAATEPSTEARTKVVADVDGNVVAAETTTVTRPPDWRAGVWVLEHRWPDRWRAASRVELSGPAGEAVPIEVRAREAAERLRRLQQRPGGILGLIGDDGPASS